MNSYQQPCIDLMTPINVQETHRGFHSSAHLSLTIPYATETFQEIQNVKDFSFETMFSSAGGFVGIFVGYSLLQMTILFDCDWNEHWKNMKLFSYLTRIFGILAVCLASKDEPNDVQILEKRPKIGSVNLRKSGPTKVSSGRNRHKTGFNVKIGKRLIAFNTKIRHQNVRIANLEEQNKQVLTQIEKNT